MDWAKATAWRDEKYFSFEIWFDGIAGYGAGYCLAMWHLLSTKTPQQGVFLIFEYGTYVEEPIVEHIHAKSFYIFKLS